MALSDKGCEYLPLFCEEFTSTLPREVAPSCVFLAMQVFKVFSKPWHLVCPVTLANRTCQRLVVGLHVFVAPVPCWESLLACRQTAMPRHRLAFSGGIVPIPGRVAHLLLMVYHCFSKVCLEIAALKWTLHRSTELQRVIEGRKSP